jgi:hypothetical protein
MATANTTSTLASRIKEQFNNDISSLVPGPNKLCKLNFRDDIELGKSAIFDVQLSDELGFSSGQGNITLNGAIAQTAARATVDAYSLILQYQASYDLISRASGGDKKAFANFTSSKFIPATESFQHRQEFYHMYGRQGLGTVLTNTSGALVISVATWCPTLWLGLTGAVIEAWTALGGSTQHDTDLTIASVDVATRTVTVTGTSSSVVATDILFFKGTHAAGHYGMMYIAQNTGSLFGISATTYPTWASNLSDVGTSALTMGKILQGSALSANKGCFEKTTCLVPVKAFQGLVADESSLRQYGANYDSKKAKNGFEGITFFGASGEIEVVPYAYLKEGEAILYPDRWTYLIGSSKMTMELGQDGKMWFDVATTSAKEMRLFSDMQLFCEKPGYITYFTRSDSLALHT